MGKTSNPTGAFFPIGLKMANLNHNLMHISDTNMSTLIKILLKGSVRHQVLTRSADVKEGKSYEAVRTSDLINQNKEQVLVLTLAVSLGLCWNV